MNRYTVEDGVIFSPRGLPFAPRYFADSRLACAVDEAGVLLNVDYYGAGTRGHQMAFVPDHWGGLKFYLYRAGKRYPLCPRDCRILPFGYTCRWEAFAFTFFLKNDSIAAVLDAPRDLEEGVSLSVEFYDSYRFRPYPFGDVRYRSGTDRTWEDWSLSGGLLRGGFAEDDGGRVQVRMGMNVPFTHKRTAANVKNRLQTGALRPGESTVFAISFDGNGEGAEKRCLACLGGFQAMIQAQRERYRRVRERSPRLESPYPSLNRFLELAPLYHESLKIEGLPGAVRANSAHYWVWGWDTLTSNDATAYWGDQEQLKGMLELFLQYADEKGIAHAFNRDMQNADPAPPPAQGMYITLLDLYGRTGGDMERYYAFARRIFHMIGQTEKEGLGLCCGTSLYPDFRSLIDETGNDVSAFNNSVCYCAVRSMERIARLQGDDETAEAALCLAGRMRRGFEQWMFDGEQGFPVCSIEADTLEKRPVYSANAIKWENNFCGELCQGTDRRILDFYEREIVSPAGLRPMPVWCEAYDADANQLSCWWPVMGECYSRLINRFDRTEGIQQWIGWVGYWTDMLMCPEGISCYAENSRPPMDTWNCLSGTWQAYSMRGWYQAAVHSAVGVDFDGGVNLYPCTGPELSLYGLWYGARRFNVHMKGSGPYAGRITVNGRALVGSCKIPADWLERENTIEVLRQSEPALPAYISGGGARLERYRYENGAVSARAGGEGETTLFIKAEKPVRILVDGREAGTSLRLPHGMHDIVIA